MSQLSSNSALERKSDDNRKRVTRAKERADDNRERERETVRSQRERKERIEKR